jgi:hypothetical protein
MRRVAVEAPGRTAVFLLMSAPQERFATPKLVSDRDIDLVATGPTGSRGG